MAENFPSLQETSSHVEDREDSSDSTQKIGNVSHISTNTHGVSNYSISRRRKDKQKLIT